MPRELVVDDPTRRVSAASWARYEQVGLDPDLDLDELVLNWTSSRIADLNARGAVVSINIERTIEGGSTVTLVLADPNGRLFKSGRTTRPSRAAAERAYRVAPVAVDEGWEPILPPDVIGRAGSRARARSRSRGARRPPISAAISTACCASAQRRGAVTT
jgi:hypothetical protein